MSTDPIRRALNGATMGTRWSALLYAPPETNVGGLEARLQNAVDRIDRQMSTWKPESDLMRFNRALPGVWTLLPPDLMRVLERGLQIGDASGGAFDIGLGNLVEAWGFGPGGAVPDPEAIKASRRARPPPAHQVLELDVSGGRARKHAGVALDVSGIAKGFAVDEMMRVVATFGIANALVSLDGELKARGTKAGGAPWRVMVEKPDDERREPFGLIELQDAAVATSGDYRHSVELAGRRWSHTMDRSRGGPTDNGTASVSIVATSCMDADAWATALLVLGPKRGAVLAEKQGLDALFIQREGGGLTEIPIGPLFAGGRQAARAS